MEFFYSFFGALVGSGLIGTILGIFLDYKTKRYLSKYESQLDYLRNLSQHFSRVQFELYSTIWSKLVELEFAGDLLWKKATHENLKKFLNELDDTKKTARKYSIIIDKEHFYKLGYLFEECWNFKSGKKTLLEIYKRNDGVNDKDVERLTEVNKKYIEAYKNILSEIEEDFRNKLRTDIKTHK